MGFRCFHKDVEVFLIYFSSSFYVVLKEGKANRENQINIKSFPNISTRGAGVQIKQYSFNRRKRKDYDSSCENLFHLRSLTLWNTNVSFLKVLNSNKSFLKSAKEEYEGKRSSELKSSADKFHSNWYYEGEVLLEDDLLQLSQVTLLLRKFQEQQSNLYFTYEYQSLPLSHHFQI